jgi:uncharacterized repeat protein (TIGR01451 family)
VQVTASLSETLANHVWIETSTPYGQGDEWSKESYWETQVQANDTYLNVNKGAWTWDPVPGYDYVYNINVCNNGGTGSTALTLTDTLPLSTTLVGWWGQHAGWSLVQSAPQELVVSRPSIQGWWCGEVYARVTLDANAWPGMPITNTATITASNDLDGNNTATVSHNAGWPHNNLGINRDWFWGTLAPGEQLHYELRYYNSGNLPVDNVSITTRCR